ncbi:MAG: class I tRNA ligase family protein, partial [Gammaproteobacteria bacterium]
VVGEDIEYVTVDTGEERLTLAAARLDVLEGDYTVVERRSGRDLLGQRYEPLFRVAGADYAGDVWCIASADYVTVEDGTGLVHIAPAFGAEDNEVGRREELPLVNPVRPDGHFDDTAPLVAGLWFKDANKPIVRDLKTRGLLYKRVDYVHNYPHDWRKGTPLMSYPVDSWFIRTTDLKDQLVGSNRTINWHPPAIREGRFGNWLENNIDWALSRKRYWGTPLPIWASDAPGSEYFEVIGSIAELREKCSETLPPDAELDLHRPHVDALTWPAPDGGTMRRVADVLDVWFDSGAMPFAQWHYPFENAEAFERNFPADFICEGIDQTRGWFYTLHAIANLVKDSVAFRNVVVNGLVLDEKGEKMSKSKGNTVDPFDVVDRYGADVVRWYLMSNSPPWDSMKFSERGLAETRGKLFGTIENVYRFMASYANIDGFGYAEASIDPADRSELDQWILSRLNSTARDTDAAFEAYDCTRAARAVEQFVDELSNWYIRRSRPRFWAAKKAAGAAGVSAADKLAAYQTTFDCLAGLAVMMSPVAPFFSDWLHRRLHEVAGLSSEASVHHAHFPACDQAVVRPELERRMALARQVVQLVLLLRNRAGVNVRQPLARMLLVTGGRVDRDAVERVEAVILDEVNVQAIEYVDNSSGVVTRTAKADFKKLGPRLGKRMKAAAAAIAALDDSAIQALVDSGGLTLELEGGAVEIGADDVSIVSEEIGDWSVAQEGGVTVALDVRVDDALRAQGYAREVVRCVQTLRKDADLELTDRIMVEYAATPALAAAVVEHEGFIARETLATGFVASDSPSGDVVRSFEIGDDESLTIAIRVDTIARAS